MGDGRIRPDRKAKRWNRGDWPGPYGQWLRARRCVLLSPDYCTSALHSLALWARRRPAPTATGCSAGGSLHRCRCPASARPDKNEPNPDSPTPASAPSCPRCPLLSARHGPLRCMQLTYLSLRKAGAYASSLEPCVCLSFLVNHLLPRHTIPSCCLSALRPRGWSTASLVVGEP